MQNALLTKSQGIKLIRLYYQQNSIIGGTIGNLIEQIQRKHLYINWR